MDDLLIRYGIILPEHCRTVLVPDNTSAAISEVEHRMSDMLPSFSDMVLHPHSSNSRDWFERNLHRHRNEMAQLLLNHTPERLSKLPTDIRWMILCYFVDVKFFPRPNSRSHTTFAGSLHSFGKYPALETYYVNEVHAQSWMRFGTVMRNGCWPHKYFPSRDECCAALRRNMDKL